MKEKGLKRFFGFAFWFIVLCFAIIMAVIFAPQIMQPTMNITGMG